MALSLVAAAVERYQLLCLGPYRRANESAIDVAAGMTVYVPEGTPHSFTSAGTRPMRAIQFYAPSGPEQRFRGMSGGS